MWDVITQPRPSFTGGLILVKPPFNLGMGWVITPHIKLCVWSLPIHVLISIKPWCHKGRPEYGIYDKYSNCRAWWRHQMETFSVLLALCEGNSPVTGGFPSERSVTRSFDFLFDLHLNKQLNKQLRCWCLLETPSPSLWRHRNGSAWWYRPFWIMSALQCRCIRGHQ